MESLGLVSGRLFGNKKDIPFVSICISDRCLCICQIEPQSLLVIYLFANTHTTSTRDLHRTDGVATGDPPEYFLARSRIHLNRLFFVHILVRGGRKGWSKTPDPRHPTCGSVPPHCVSSDWEQWVHPHTGRMSSDSQKGVTRVL